MTDGDDVWGGWEANTDYVVNAGEGNDKLYGYDGNDELNGEAGNDEIYGGRGNDRIWGGWGLDKLFGGDGDDEIDGGEGNDELFGGKGKDRLKGGKGKDKLFGGEDDDELDGGEGDDELFGEAGRDKLWGRFGKDKLFGGDGDDELNGGADDDQLFGDAGNDLLYGEEGADLLFGNLGDDLLEGGSGNDSLYGEGGDDLLFGGSENDVLDGAAGNDQLQGDEGDDELFGQAGLDSLNGSAGDDYLNGGDDDDVLVGGTGFDILQGGSGDDTLDGVDATGLGVGTIDILIGESGADRFILGNAVSAYYDDGDGNSAGTDDYAVIKDLNRLQDSIQLNGSSSDYVVGDVPVAIATSFAGMDASAIYRDTDNSGDLSSSDELIAAIEYVAPSELGLDASYFDYSDGNAVSLHPSADSNWELVFSDEFDGSSLDLNKWNTTYYYGSRTNLWNDEEQYYVDDAFTFKGDGTLSIEAKKLDNPLEAFEAIDQQLLTANSKSTSFDYTSGLLSGDNKFGFTNGYMEMRAQVPSGQGLWSAFWMLPSSGEWPPELDIMEALGDQTDAVITTQHFLDENNVHQVDLAHQNFADIDFSSGFHTYAAEWNQDKITWFVDDVEIFSAENKLENQPMYLLANLAVGGSLPGATTADTPVLSSFDIDYIRVYQDESGVLHGGSADDQLSRELGGLSGEVGNDILAGGAGDNTLIGGYDSDILLANAGDDVLIGVHATAWNAGEGEIDQMTGGSGQDRFVLGEGSKLFYQAVSGGDGAQDYARIMDFNPVEDLIQLTGSAAQYSLQRPGNGQSTEIFHSSGDLVAVLDQTAVTSMTQGFVFV